MSEKEKVEDLEHQLAQVLHIKEQLMEDLKQYEGMEQRVKKMKDGVSCMFKKLLKSKPVPPEQENPENLEFVKKIKELMDELEVRKIEVRKYHKLEILQLFWANDLDYSQEYSCYSI